MENELETKPSDIQVTTEYIKTTDEEKLVNYNKKQIQTINTGSGKIKRPMTSIKRNIPARPQTAMTEKATDILFKNNAIQNIILEDKASEVSDLNERIKEKSMLAREPQKNLEMNYNIAKDVFNLNPNKQNLYKIKLTKSASKYNNKVLTSNKNSFKDLEVDDLFKVEKIKVNNYLTFALTFSLKLKNQR